MFIEAPSPAAMDVARPERVRNRKERFDQVWIISLAIIGSVMRRLGGTRKLGICRCVPAAETSMAVNMMPAASMP